MSSDPLDATTEQLTVLLIDDDPEWAEFMTTMLERDRPEFSVLTTSNTETGLSLVRETPAIDCIVSDYQMPEMDGLELLSAARSIRPDIPFILVTGQGDESVASEAISSGVSDYVVKTQRAARSTTLARRVTKAVENYRLRRQVTESEERYRSLVEQSTDAIVISRDGVLTFANARACEMTGYDLSALDGLSWVDLLHADDLDAATALWDTDSDTAPEGAKLSFEARLVRPDSSTRTGAFSVSRISYDGCPAMLCNIRDVTDQQARKRQLRKERNIKSAFRDTLMHSSTRDDLEASVCRTLVSAEGYELAWVGELDDERLEPRTWSGGDGRYFDSMLGENEPSRRAVDSGAAVYVDDIAASPDATWRDVALDCDYRSVAAVPLVYDGISYGVLSVYTSETGVLDDRERELLTDMAEGLAYGINSLQKTTAVTSDSVVELALRIEAPDDVLCELTAAGLGGSVTVRDAVARSDAVVLFLVTDGVDTATVVDALGTHDGVVGVEVVDATTNRLRAAVEAPTVGTTLRKHGCSVQRLTFADGAADVRLAFPVTRDITAAIDVLRDEFAAVTVRSVSERNRTRTSPQDRLRASLGDITDKQLQALRTAYHCGYFEQPRESSADEVASVLDISRSTFLQHFRAGQRKMFTSLFDDGP